MNYPAKTHFEVPYDPESLLTGAEIDVGMTYADHRIWPDEDTKRRAYSGELTSDEIVRLAPRKRGAVVHLPSGHIPSRDGNVSLIESSAHPLILPDVSVNGNTSSAPLKAISRQEGVEL